MASRGLWSGVRKFMKDFQTGWAQGPSTRPVSKRDALAAKGHVSSWHQTRCRHCGKRLKVVSRAYGVEQKRYAVCHHCGSDNRL